jgi:hypothetical protein
MGRPEKRRLINYTDVGDVTRRDRADDPFRIDAEPGDINRPCHRRCGKVTGMSDRAYYPVGPDRRSVLGHPYMS